MLMEIKTAIGRRSDKAFPKDCKVEAAGCGHHQGRIVTSVPERKTPQHLIEREAYRRIMSGEAPETLAEFTRQLLDWFNANESGASPITQDNVEDWIRETWHRRHELIRGG